GRAEQGARQVLADVERRAELVKANVITAAEAAVGEQKVLPLDAHFDAYDEHLRAKGVTKIHREDTGRYLKRLAADCGFKTLADLHRERLARWLATEANGGRAARAGDAYRDARQSLRPWVR